MNNVLVYCELTENNHIADISLELCTKGRQLATEMNGRLQAVVAGSNVQHAAAELYPYGVDEVFIADDTRLAPYRTLPHFEVVLKVVNEQQPDVMLFGATTVGRDLAPRVSSRLRCGLTADCTALELGDHTDTLTGKEYKGILHQIRPAFGGNIVATIITPEHKPQMATVREGVMRKEVLDANYKGTATNVDIAGCLDAADKAVTIIRREIVEKSINIKGASIIVAGGYGVGSKENFKMLHDLAHLIGGEVGATRAAVDAGFCEPERQIGQTGVTVRPRLYIACGISGAVQHRAGMDQSSKIISINTDPNAPINAIADYTIIGDVCAVLPMMMDCYSNNLK
ncbi:MAG: electron transfer flavoprotein subunit alpha/FixB family protein [Bacteroidales bacterium]|nr:electron transfer flavoprotein subunit alpha/FixB family protein [Candidatus Colimorpha merdihippi]MCQ2282990.1 electron transfer flavoprotein subunit alpha/FixB family protein [Bacteroidales bacterium]